jgi:S-adenosylmethionine:tRNA ribosyltransferase-isomerase
VIAANVPIQRPGDGKLLAIDGHGQIRHLPRARFSDLLTRGDLVVANDAATLPASLAGVHVRTGQPVEVRLAGRRSLAAGSIRFPAAVVFGAGDFSVRTEDRPLPPLMRVNDRLRLGPLRAIVETVLQHPRLVRLAFQGSVAQIWEGLVRYGRPIQYSHVRTPLALWDVWTPIAGPPVAFEPPSAGFALDWSILASMRERGIQFATITHAAGISSTGDAALDALLPFDEPYYIPPVTALAVSRAHDRGGRIVAIGTTVVRAMEHAAQPDGSVRPGAGLATQRVGRATSLCVVDAMLSGTHEPGTSHYELLRAFVNDDALRRMDEELNQGNYRTHEFGDSVFVERMGRAGALSEQQPCAA